MDHQQVLRAAIEADGTKPHPLRFFRADHPIIHSQPTRALLALGSLTLLSNTEGMLRVAFPQPSSYRTHDLIAHLFSTICVRGRTHKGQQSVRALPIAGHGPGRALVFADSSVLFARQDANQFHFWPGIAWLRGDGPRLDAQSARWSVSAKVGSTAHPPRLQVAIGQSAAAERGVCFSMDTTWHHAPTAPLERAHLLLDRLRQNIDAITDRLGEFPCDLLPHIDARGTRWPTWMAYRAVEEDEAEAILDATLPLFRWLALGLPNACAITVHTKVGFFRPPSDGPRPITLEIAFQGGKTLQTTVATILERMALPDQARAQLARLQHCTIGLDYDTTHNPSNTFPTMFPPGLQERCIDALPTSAHARMASAAQLLPLYGAPPDWTPLL